MAGGGAPPNHPLPLVPCGGCGQLPLAAFGARGGNAGDCRGGCLHGGVGESGVAVVAHGVASVPFGPWFAFVVPSCIGFCSLVPPGAAAGTSMAATWQCADSSQPRSASDGAALFLRRTAQLSEEGASSASCSLPCTPCLHLASTASPSIAAKGAQTRCPRAHKGAGRGGANDGVFGNTRQAVVGTYLDWRQRCRHLAPLEAWRANMRNVVWDFRSWNVDQKRDLVMWLDSWVWTLATDRGGTVLLQQVIKAVPPVLQVSLARELEDHVREAWESDSAKYANYVLQTCITEMSPAKIRFVLDHIVAQCSADVGVEGHPAVSCHGCRVMQRTIEHFDPNLFPQIDDIFSWIAQHVVRLALDEFGNYVVQHALEHGTRKHRNQITEALIPCVVTVATSPRGSFVIQKALEYASGEHRHRLVQHIVSAPKSSIKNSRYGSFLWKMMRHMASSSPATSSTTAYSFQ
eukprot:TRINITY_DN9642_c1_g1_i1.p1 TRINITY_DN9642_c1_g1~~TRINITY_DN9642_c1_g1_i1.p1  ORF type:complete len:530 (-),score=57.52 TRINITY_DN9642_c1_g1_i1:249-1634(-)